MEGHNHFYQQKKEGRMEKISRFSEVKDNKGIGIRIKDQSIKEEYLIIFIGR